MAGECRARLRLARVEDAGAMGRVFVAARGATRLHIGVLAANEPARRFYEAIGGRLVGSRPYEEDGYTLEEAVYAWEIERLVHAE